MIDTCKYADFSQDFSQWKSRTFKPIFDIIAVILRPFKSSLSDKT